MAGFTLKEFIVKLGFKVDEASFKKMNDQLKAVESKLHDIAGVVAATAVAVEVNVSRMSDKFFHLSIAAKAAHTSIAELQRMERGGQAAGFDAGQMTEMAKALRQKMRAEPWIIPYLQGQGVDMSHGPEAALTSLAEVTKRRFPEEKGMGYLANMLGETAGVSSDQLTQLQDQLGEYKKGSDTERREQGIAAIKPDELGRRGSEYYRSELDFKAQRDRAMDISAGEMEPVANKLLMKATELTTSFTGLNAAVQALLTTLAIGGVFTAIGTFLKGKALGGLARTLFGGGGAAGEAGGALAGAAEGTAVAAEAGGAATGAGALLMPAGVVAAEGAGAAGAAVGSGAALAGGEGLLAAAGPIGWGIAGLAALGLGGYYGGKKLGLWGQEKPKGSVLEGMPTGAAAGGGVMPPIPPGFPPPAGDAGPAPMQQQFALPPPPVVQDAGEMRALLAMLEDHWQQFTKLWSGGIDIKGGGAVSVAEAPGAGGHSVYQNIKAFASDAMQDVGKAATWTGQKLGALGKYGMGGLDALRKGGFQAMTKKFEGWRDKQYDDVGGKGTVGYGHLVRPGEDFRGGLTKEQGEALFQKDYGEARRITLMQTKGIKLNEAQVGALTDLVYGIGGLTTKDKSGHTVDRTILRDLKAGNFDQVAKDFTMYSGYHDKAGNFKQSQPLYDRHLAESMAFSGQAGLPDSPQNTMNQKTTINVYGVTEPAAVASRLKSEQGRVNNEAMRNLSARTG